MKCILYNEMHFYIMKIDREAFFRAMVGTKGYKEKTLSGKSSSPHPHRILTSSSSSSPHPRPNRVTQTRR